jgi:hypothetical protein
MKTEQPTFWLTNVSNRNVSLTDLNLTVKAYSSINLLDKKHYQYTLEEIQKSVTSGSVFKKRDKLTVRKVAPEILKANVPLLRETFIPSRERSVFAIKEENYEELMVDNENQKASDEQFARDNADIIELDGQSLFKKV